LLRNAALKCKLFESVLEHRQTLSPVHSEEPKTSTVMFTE
jgi:hypothetical protein